MMCGAGRSVAGGEPDRRARRVSEVEALARNGSGFGELTGWAGIVPCGLFSIFFISFHFLFFSVFSFLFFITFDFVIQMKSNQILKFSNIQNNILKQ
jgi:hypothetical protein